MSHTLPRSTVHVFARSVGKRIFAERMKNERYTHFYIAENQLCHPGYEFILHMDFPRCFIRYKLGEGYFSGYDEFFASVAEVQWIDGVKPSEAEQQRILTAAWNFLALDERLLEGDIDAINDEDDDQ
jgi:hypothetical protein